jgi:hypothetical protein
MAVLGICFSPRRRSVWIALAVNAVCLLLLSPMSGNVF